MSVLSLNDVARAGVEFGDREFGDRDLYRAAIGALDEAMNADVASVSAWLDAEPALTGRPHADALVAAVAEHVAFHRDIEAPIWVEHAHRFLHSA